jgi:hypothetical protein
MFNHLLNENALYGLIRSADLGRPKLIEDKRGGDHNGDSGKNEAAFATGAFQSLFPSDANLCGQDY